MGRAQVQSLVRELRFCKSCDVKKKKKNAVVLQREAMGPGPPRVLVELGQVPSLSASLFLAASLGDLYKS